MYHYMNQKQGRAPLWKALLSTIPPCCCQFPRETGAAWYEAGCAWAVKNGISDGKNPGEAISREEFAEVLYRYAEYLGRDMLARADLSSYLDAGEVSEDARSAMQWAVGETIIKGHDFRLDPKDGTTRAEACAMLRRFFK